VTLTILTLVCGVSFWLGASSSRSKDVTESLVVGQQYLDFGEVWEDPAFAWVIPIENRSAETIRIVEFVPTCSCTAVKPSQLELTPGTKSEVRLTLDLRDRRVNSGTTSAARSQPASIDASIREFSVEVASRAQDIHGHSLPSMAWTIRGKVRKGLSLNPSVLNFGESLFRGSTFAPRSVIVEAHTPLRSLEAKCDPAKASVEVRRPAHGDNRYELTILPRETLPSGDLEFAIPLSAVTEDGSRLPPVELRVQGRIQDDIQSTPSTVVLGACSQGHVVSDTVVLWSHSGKPFEVDRVECDAQGLTVERGKTLADGKEFRITQKIVNKGEHSTSIRFVLRPGGTKSNVVLPLNVSYLGAPD
jgi:hypothetical protein